MTTETLDPPVRLDVSDGVATLTLSDPAHLNALGMPLLQAALQALDRVRDDPQVRALLLRGTGRAFCVGADLATFNADPSPQGRADTVDGLLAQGGNPLVLALNTLPVPVLCAVHGAVAGGGVGLALAADLVIAARSAFFYLPFVPALGLVPDMGASWFLARALGPARAKALMLTGQRLGAEQAADWGLIWRCVDDQALDAEASAAARQLAALPPLAAPEVRALLQQAERNDLPAQLEHERARQRALIAGPSFEAGLQAFLHKRPPVFAPR
jgi:2-(1,2-epoxy-1,2-dihydrophenyl)acetyl-CoA isomerase